jgi:hypothetical protein
MESGDWVAQRELAQPVLARRPVRFDGLQRQRSGNVNLEGACLDQTLELVDCFPVRFARHRR